MQWFHNWQYFTSTTTCPAIYACCSNHREHWQYDLTNYSVPFSITQHACQKQHLPVKMAVATIISSQTDMLFDEGSQCSFLTQELTDSLSLKPHKTENILPLVWINHTIRAWQLQLYMSRLNPGNTYLSPRWLQYLPSCRSWPLGYRGRPHH